MINKTFLSHVNKPARYLGCEFNIFEKPAEDYDWSCVLVFPDLYEIGMSHQGLHILYQLLNRQPHIVAERSYCPAPDAEMLLKARGLPLTSLENGRPLADFDLIGITLPHELCYTNILTILDRSALPFSSHDRGEAHPIVLGGGTCAFNPEPVAQFFDAILIGDGEEAIVEIAAMLRRLKLEGHTKKESLARLADIKGVYLPHLYQPEYDQAGRIEAIHHAPDAPARARRRVLADLNAIDHLKQPLVPNAKIVHDRLGIEVARGCTRGCRFCQAGITYRPVRERSGEHVLELAESGIDNTGFAEIALLSLSTGDYSCLTDVLPRLMRRFEAERVSVSMPSMRVGTLTRELMDEIRKVRKTGFTLAPEAGSERLRRVINKGITETDLLTGAATAFSLGWNLIKLYFMIGLPTENDTDIEAIIDVARKTAAAGQVTGRSRKRITVSVGTFVPKPHTPFQWEAQLDVETSRKRMHHLKAALKGQGINLKYHDPEQSYLEGVFARGDRRLTPLIIRAWHDGARLDSWSDYFDMSRWRTAAHACALNLDWYLREREQNEIMPWHHIDCGVTHSFLIKERARARALVHTPDCRYETCQKCGLCDFKTVQPIVVNRNKSPQPLPCTQGAHGTSGPETAAHHFKYFVSYSRTGPICFLGHLEFLQVIHRGIKRAGITVHYSHGFNPSPKISFGPALPVGTESLCEFFIMDLPQPLRDTPGYVKRLSRMLPRGVAITTITVHNGKTPQDIVCSYEVRLPFELNDSDIQKIKNFLNREELIIERLRKGKTRQINIRPLIQALHLPAGNRISLDMVSKSGEPGIKPIAALQIILEKTEAQLLNCHIQKTAWTQTPRQSVLPIE